MRSASRGGRASAPVGRREGAATHVENLTGEGSPGIEPGRYARLYPSELTPVQSVLYRAIVGSERARESRPFPLVDVDGRLNGPFNAMLYAPHVGEVLEKLGRVLRYEGSLSPRLREVAILAVAAEVSCGYEWALHSHAASSLGVPASVLSQLATGGDLGSDASSGDACVVGVVRELLRTNALSDGRFEEAVELLEEDGLFELVVLASHYRLLALIIAVFQGAGSGGDGDVGLVASPLGAQVRSPKSRSSGTRGKRNGSR